MMLKALEIAHAVEAGDMSPETACALGGEAIAAREPELCVFTDQTPIPPTSRGKMDGITVGVKDIFDTADAPSRYGSAIYSDHRPIADAAIVAMLRATGATIPGKTVTTEFAWFQPGPTRNPHNPEHTPGGSSSGSAAGVAAGYFAGAVGSQTGGSVIRPAAFCGVAGYKPSFRLFPTVGMKCFSWSLDTTGFFAARVADVAFMAEACSGRDLMVATDEGNPPRIGLYRSPVDDQASAIMHKALDDLAVLAAHNGAQVTEITADQTVERARAAHAPIQDYEASHALLFERVHHPEKLSEKLHDHLVASQAIAASDYDEARRTANRARKAVRDLFQDIDVLLLPSAPGAAPHGLETTGDSVFNRLWTLLGVPCVNVPGLMDEAGLPLGVQVVAPFGSDALALQAAHWLEQLISSR